MLARLAHVIAHRRWYVIGAWVVLTFFGAFAAGQVSKRWFQSFSIPGYSAYEASQRTIDRFGTGERPPNVVVFQTTGDASKSEAIRAAMQRAAKASPHARSSSFYSTGSDAYVSRDRHTTFMELYPAGSPKFDTKSGAGTILKAAKNGLPAGIAVHVTGHDAIAEASAEGETTGPSVLLEAVIGGIGALVILFFVFGTLPAVMLPLAIAVASILNTFTLVLPLPFIRSMGIGGMLIPAVSVLCAITLLPALLATLGQRINSVRLLPKRLVDRGHPEDGAWGRWARLVNRRPIPVAAVGLAITGVLVFYGLQLNPNEAQMKNVPGSGDAIVGRDVLTAAGITPGVHKPFDVLVEHGGDPEAIAAKLRGVEGISAAVAPKDWRKGDASIVEAFPAVDGASSGIQSIIDRSKEALKGTNATLRGTPAVDRDFVHAIYGNFPYLLAFVLILTFILLARAFRSLVLPLKAAILNLVSLAAAFGIVVFIFQDGHGSSLWSIDATQAITAWIPLMIFAFLFGLSMDYEVFMLTRMREAYDETGSTSKAIELGLARTGKLVTSAALVLMCAFLVLSTGPGFLIKELAIGLAAGIIFDATVVRALLVPATMRLLGNANWWMPAWAHRPLLIRAPEELPEAATESA